MIIDELLLEKVRNVLTKIWMPGDPFSCNDVSLRHYAMKATVCQHAKPQKILEIGTRAGYGLAAMHIATPTAQFICVDGGFDSNSPQMLAHAKKVIQELGINANLIIVNSHAIREISSIDFAHVDGDHTYDGAKADLKLAANARTILADDCCNSNVKRAVEEFAHETNKTVEYFNDGLRAGAVITANN